MKEIVIDLNRVRKALPNRAVVNLIKYKEKHPAIECIIEPSLSENDFEMCKQWQREIIGDENILEFYTEETGLHWYVFLTREKIISFEGISDENIKSFTGLDISKIP